MAENMNTVVFTPEKVNTLVFLPGIDLNIPSFLKIYFVPIDYHSPDCIHCK